MKLVRIVGVAHTLSCAACKKTGVGGTQSYESAATGETREPEEWYIGADGFGPYCASCAVKIAEAVDPTRSVAQFYSNTTGEQIESEHLLP